VTDLSVQQPGFQPSTTSDHKAPEPALFQGAVFAATTPLQAAKRWFDHTEATVCSCVFGRWLRAHERYRFSRARPG